LQEWITNPTITKTTNILTLNMKKMKRKRMLMMIWMTKNNKNWPRWDQWTKKTKLKKESTNDDDEVEEADEAAPEAIERLDAPRRAQMSLPTEETASPEKNCEVWWWQDAPEMLRLEQCHNLTSQRRNGHDYSPEEARYCEDHGWSKLEHKSRPRRILTTIHVQ
jgi:hypothetical protein